MSRADETPTAVPPSFDPNEMRRRGRIGAHRLHALHDSREITARGRASFLKKFEDEVDPDGMLPEEERRRRAAHARKAHFQRLARLSANARRGKRNDASGQAILPDRPEHP